MASPTDKDWENPHFQNLKDYAEDLVKCDVEEKQKKKPPRRGRSKKEKVTKEETLDNVQKELKVLAKHPYNTVYSSANPGNTGLDPEARGPARRLHTELKRLLESKHSEAHQKDVQKHMKSLASVLVPSTGEPKPVEEDSVGDEPGSASFDKLLRNVDQGDLNVDRMFDEILEGTELDSAIAEENEDQIE